jgi:hypothetical protein
MLLDFMLGSPLTQSWFLSPTASDFNNDRWVNVDDLSTWSSGFGVSGSATHMHGDVDGDQDVDGGDFLVWQRQLGSAAIAAVPEPAIQLQLAWGLLVGTLFSRKVRLSRYRQPLREDSHS